MTTRNPPDAGLDNAEAPTLPAWLRCLPAPAQAGCDPIGPDHGAVYIDGGDTLLVTFEHYAPLQRGGNPVPLASASAEAQNWSRLHLLARRPDWFRAAIIAEYMRAQADGGFWDGFSRIIFAGIGMGGYAACAYASAAPGAVVLAVSPQASLATAHAGWDQRWPAARRLDFTGEFGYAPSGIVRSEKTYILHDPAQPLDAMHAGLFRHPKVRHLRCPNLSGRTGEALLRMGLIDQLLGLAEAGTLDTESFARLCRARRRDATWLAAKAGGALAAGQPARALIFARALQELDESPDAAALLGQAQAALRASLP